MTRYIKGDKMDVNAMDTIFAQAILFFTLFGTMFIVSFFISRKGAKKFESEHSLEERKAAAKKEKLIDMFLNSSIIKIQGKEATLMDLAYDLKKGAINKEEFKILKETLAAS